MISDVKEISRTPRYMVLSRQRGTALFVHLFALRREVVRLRAHNDGLRDQLEEQSALLGQALHQLARTRKEEPQLFSRTWLTAQRARANGRRR